MKLYIFLLGLALLVVPSLGRNANTGEYPAHVAILMANNRFGEGVILNENHVVTVASNVVLNGQRLAPSTVNVRAGIISLQQTPIVLMSIIRIYVHENYNQHNNQNNIAILRTATNFDFTPNVVIPLIQPSEIHNRIVADSILCDLVGWNNIPNHQTTTMQVLNLPVLNRDTCNLLNNQIIQGRVYDQHSCVGALTANTAVCNNNPGAGYYCGGRIAGILSTGRQCGTLNSPAIIVQIRWHSAWIQRQFNRTDFTPAGNISPPEEFSRK